MNEYQTLRNLLKDNTYQMATNTDGENIIFEVGENENGKYVKTLTCQRNDWLRVEVYYENGDYEELYDK